MRKLLKKIFISTLACILLSGSVIGTSAAANKGVIYYVGNASCNNGCFDCGADQAAVQNCTKKICNLLEQLGCNAASCRDIAIRICNGCPQEAVDEHQPAPPAATEPAAAVPTAPTKPIPTEPAPTEPKQPEQPVKPTEAVIPPTEKPTEAAVPNGALSAYESEVVRLVNEIRAQYGLSTLTANTELSKVARLKSQDMHDKGYFDHNSPTYGSPFDMMKTFGIRYRTAGENIAMGYRTPQSVVDGWMNSPGHRANILNAGFTQIGVGYVAQGNYWTQMFIG